MSRCCNNCINGIYHNNYLDFKKTNMGNNIEGMICALNGFHINAEERCKEHKYMSGCEEYKTYVMYDDSYLNPGYFIISELDGKIVKFVKIYSSTNGYQIPHYGIRVFEENSIDESEYQYRDIVLKANSGEKLFNVFRNFAFALKGAEIMSIDPANEGENSISAKTSKKEALLLFKKDVYGAREATNFIDINIGDNMICRYYGVINNFYRNLAEACIKKADVEDVQKILRLTK